MNDKKESEINLSPAFESLQKPNEGVNFLYRKYQISFCKLCNEESWNNKSQHDSNKMY